MQFKSMPLEVKVDMDHRTFEGYASTFGNVDLGNDRVKRGAYKKTIRERFKKNLIKTLWQHYEPFGRVEALKEDEHGLLFKSFVSRTTLGDDGLELMRDGVVDRMSIGYETVKSKWIEKDGCRELIELKLFEISPVTFAMNEEATINAVKSFLDKMPLDVESKSMMLAMAREQKFFQFDNKTVVAYQNLPLAPRDHNWDADEAIERVKEWADAQEEPNTTFRRDFLWYDADNQDLFGSYKLPIADIIDGKLTTVPRAVFAASAAIQGARGGVDIPVAEVDGVKRHLEKYYAKMREEFDDDTIVAPWLKFNDDIIAKTAMTIRGIQDQLGITMNALSTLTQPEDSTGKKEQPHEVDEVDPDIIQSALDEMKALNKSFQKE